MSRLVLKIARLLSVTQSARLSPMLNCFFVNNRKPERFSFVLQFRKTYFSTLQSRNALNFLLKRSNSDFSGAVVQIFMEF